MEFSMLNTDLWLLCLASFAAGFVDSIVGGGGLIQLPAVFSILTGYPVVTLLATNKLVSVSGTAFSAWRFSKQIKFSLRIVVPAVVSAFLFSVTGAWVVSQVSNETLKPVFLVLMFFVFIFTIRSKDFGMINHAGEIEVPLWKPIVIGSVLGFYDGFFGPGTGTFLILAFVGLVGMTFVQGSAYAKMINLTTNVAALCFFALKGEFLLQYALPMMMFNMSGAYLGVRMALLKGSTFVRALLRCVVFGTISKMAWDHYFK
jgi:uncharacterized protein